MKNQKRMELEDSYGVSSPPDDPAVHITFDEASAFCR